MAFLAGRRAAAPGNPLIGPGLAVILEDWEVAVVVPKAANLISVTVDGATVPLEASERREGPQRDFQVIGSVTTPPEGVEVVLVLGKTEPFDGFVYDLSAGLPPAADALLRARPASAVAFQDGDTTVLTRKVRL